MEKVESGHIVGEWWWKRERTCSDPMTKENAR